LSSYFFFTHGLQDKTVAHTVEDPFIGSEGS